MLDHLVYARNPSHGKLVGMTIHQAIKNARLAKGWSMEELADKVSAAEGSAKKLSWQTVQQWENGTSAPRRHRMETVAQLLDMKVQEMIVSSPDQDHATGLEQSVDMPAPELLSLLRKHLDTVQNLAQQLESSLNLMASNQLSNFNTETANATPKSSAVLKDIGRTADSGQSDTASGRKRSKRSG